MPARIRKYLCVLLGVAVLCLMLAPVVAAQNSQSLQSLAVYINGSPLQLETEQTTIVNGRTMLLLCFIAENLGCRVSWDPVHQMVTVSYTAS